jgi:hypothetical protein
LQRIIPLVQNPDMLESDRTSLFQFLVAISNAMPDRAQQQHFIAELSANMLTDLHAEPVTQAASSFRYFVGCVGLAGPATPGSAEEAAVWEFRSKLRTVIVNLSGILRGIQATTEEKMASAGVVNGDAVLAGGDDDDGATQGDGRGLAVSVPLLDVAGAARTSVMLQAGWPLISTIMPQVLRLVTMVHSLWTPPARQSLPAAMRSLFQTSKEELQFLQDADRAIKEKAGTAAVVLAPADDVSVSPEQRHVHACQSWLYSIRENMYMILGAATLAGPSFYQTYTPQMLVSSVFSHLDAMDTGHLRALFGT